MSSGEAADGSAKARAWLPIESNPEVMNRFLSEGGVPKSWVITDVFGLDEPLLAMVPKPVAALLLLFPTNEKYHDYCKQVETTLSGDSQPAVPSDLYYMKQSIPNACGTVALIHAVANNRDKFELAADSHLGKFLAATKDMNPEDRAKKLEGDEDISQAHEQVAQEGQTSAPSVDESVEYHFIAFVEKEGCVYEMDGRKSGPHNCGKIEDGQDFLTAAAQQCKDYMARDPENINFTVVAFTKAE